MNILDHFSELRTRLVKVLIAITACSVLAYWRADLLFALITKPFFASFSGQELIGTGPAEAFLIKIKLAIIAGCLIAIPFIFMQIWLFISPGLLENEKKLCLPFIGSSSFLFLFGVYFAYAFVLPFTFDFFFSQYESINVQANIKLSEHVSLMLKILISFGIIFELPVLTYLLARLNIVTSEILKKYFRHAIVVIFALAAILTPPDVVSQFLMAVPLIILYVISIYIAAWAQKKS